jgi:transposase
VLGARDRTDDRADRARLVRHATGFTTGRQAAAFVGLNPSNWESGLMAAPSRPITKEGPPELRLALYQAANVACRRDPQLACATGG